MARRVITRGARASSILSKDNIHLQRYLRAKIGISPEQIAKEHGVQLDTVKESIAKVDVYRQLHTLDFANEAAVGVVVGAAGEIGRAILRGATATKRIVVGNGTEVVDDHATQQKAVENFTGLVTAIQPKGGKGVSVSVSANSTAQSAASSHSETRTMGYEERLRKVSQQVEAESTRKSEVGTTFDDEEVEDDEEDEGEVVPELTEGGDGPQSQESVD